MAHPLYIDLKFPWKLAPLCSRYCSRLLFSNVFCHGTWLITNIFPSKSLIASKSKLLIDIYVLLPCLSFNSINLFIVILYSSYYLDY